jgi:HlyD family secretion protein
MIMIRKLALWIAAALAAGCLLYWYMQPTVVVVETAPVRQGRFTVTVDADARTRVRQRYVVSAPIAGRLERVRLKVGDRIDAGVVVAVLRPNLPPLIDQRSRRELEERLGAAEAQVEEAEALHAKAKAARDKTANDYDRTRQLQERGVASVMAFDRDKTAAEQAARDLVAAERRAHAAVHQRTEAEEALKRGVEPANPDVFELRAPVAGSVLRVAQESEAALQPGASLVEIGDTTDLEIVAEPLTTDAVQMRPGAPVAIERWGGSAPLEGRVRLVEPAGFTKVSALGVEEQRALVVMDITSPVEARRTLGDGYRVEVRITLEEIAEATIIPVGALFRKNESWQAFVVEDGSARLRQVKLLRRSGVLAAIGDDLRPGAAVVMFPPGALADGSPIRIR